MNKTAFKAKIFGLVQGVGFRFFAQRKASEYGVAGYVKNLPDGTVETYAEGDKAVLEQFLSDLKKGPMGASVSDVIIDWFSESNNYSDFTIAF